MPQVAPLLGMVVDRQLTVLWQVPESICNLTRLVDLDLERNHIDAISPCISRLSKLRRLDLSSNNLAEVRSMLGLE